MLPNDKYVLRPPGGPRDHASELPGDPLGLHHPGACTSYRPGHRTHWIQALHSINQPEAGALTWRGRVLAVQGTALLVERDTDHAHLLFRHHDADRLASKAYGQVEINDQYAIMRIGGDSFSVRRDTGEPLEACPTDELPPDPTVGQLVERIDTHGGYSEPLHKDASQP